MFKCTIIVTICHPHKIYNGVSNANVLVTK